MFAVIVQSRLKVRTFSISSIIKPGVAWLLNKNHTQLFHLDEHTPVYWLQIESGASQQGTAYRGEPRGSQMLP